MLKSIQSFLFSSQTIRQTLAKNAFWLTVSNVVSNFLRLGITIYAARLLGAAEYGFFSYAISIVATFAIISDLGLNNLITINIVQRKKAGQLYFSTLMFLRFILILITVVLAILIGPTITRFPEAKVLIWIIALFLAFDDARSLLNSLPRSENRIDKEAFASITTNLLTFALCLISLKYSPTAYLLAVIYLIGSGIGALITFIIVKKGWVLILKPFQFSFKLAKDILAIAVPFGLASAMWTVMVNTDIFIIGWLQTPIDLGYYAAAQRPVIALAIVPSILVGSSLSILAYLAKEGLTERLKKFIEQLTTLSLAIAFPLVMGGIIIAPSLIYFLYGSEYIGATLSFQFLLITLIPIYSSSIISNLILIYKQQKNFTIAMVAGALANIGLDFLLIPFFGIAGSAMATVFALAIIYGYLWHIMKKMLSLTIIKYLPRIAIATAIMGLVTWLLYLTPLNFWINILISSAVYLATLFFTKEPLLKDLKGIFVKI